MEILITFVLDCAAIALAYLWAPAANRDVVVAYTLWIAALILIGSTWSFSRRRKYPAHVRPRLLLIFGWLAPLGCMSTVAFLLLLIVSEQEPEVAHFLLFYGPGMLLLLPAVFTERRLRSVRADSAAV